MYNYINKRLYILIYFIRSNKFNKPLIRVCVLHQGQSFQVLHLENITLLHHVKVLLLIICLFT